MKFPDPESLGEESCAGQASGQHAGFPRAQQPHGVKGLSPSLWHSGATGREEEQEAKGSSGQFWASLGGGWTGFRVSPNPSLVGTFAPTFPSEGPCLLFPEQQLGSEGAPQRLEPSC